MTEQELIEQGQSTIDNLTKILGSLELLVISSKLQFGENSEEHSKAIIYLDDAKFDAENYLRDVDSKLKEIKNG